MYVGGGGYFEPKTEKYKACGLGKGNSHNDIGLFANGAVIRYILLFWHRLDGINELVQNHLLNKNTKSEDEVITDSDDEQDESYDAFNEDLPNHSVVTKKSSSSSVRNKTGE